MDLTQAIVVAVASALLGLLCGWMGAKPWDPRKGPRMLPYPFLMLVAFCVAIYAAVYAWDVSGITVRLP